MTETMDTNSGVSTKLDPIPDDEVKATITLESILNENGTTHDDAGTSGISLEMKNGNSEPSSTDPPSSLAVPPVSVTPESDFVASVPVDGEVSPSSLRRSTRASALKAQEKLKVKDGMDVYAPNGLTHHHHNHHDGGLDALRDAIQQNGDSHASAITNKDEPASKKPKLNHGLDLDQYDWKFGVRMDKDDVYMLSDESEISSLNSAEVTGLRKNYEEFKNAGVSEEQQYERDAQVRELEIALRSEENKLVTLKKIVQNQKEAEAEVLKRQKAILEFAEKRQQFNAYKPTVAATPAKANGTKGGNKAKPNARDNNVFQNLDPTQQQIIFQKLLANPQFASQATQLLPKHYAQALAAHHNIGKSSSVGSGLTNMAAQQQQHQQQASKKESQVPTTTPAQRAAEARRKLRSQLDQQLLSIPAPKAPSTEMNFVPSATNDFCYLLGLDLTVQRVLKDKNVFKKYEEKPYVCEECGTDFTPVWKAIGSSENDLHLYCEACVKAAQKRKMKNDHASLYKKAFAKIAEQEKELEKQIAAGKFDDPPAPPPPPAPPSKPSTPVNSKASSSNASMPTSVSAGNMNMANMAYMIAQQQAKAKAAAVAAAAQAQQPSTSAQTSRSQSNNRGTKRAANTTPQAPANNQNVMQQHMLNMLRSNPMFLAMMNGGQANMMPALISLMNGANAGGSGRGGSNANNNQSSNLATMALLQAAMQSNQLQQMHGGSGNNSNNNAQQMMQQFAMLQNQNMLASLMQNPTMLQNLQRMQAANNKSKK